MLGKLLELLTGKDDLERVACQSDTAKLVTYLKTRALLIPRKPSRFIDASGLTREELLVQLRGDSEEFSKEAATVGVQPWILEMNGKKRLPAFSSLKKAEIFVQTISQDMGKVFAVGYVEVSWNTIAEFGVDVVDINPFCPRCWEISVAKHDS